MPDGLSTDAFRAMRIAASVAVAAPGIRLLIRDGKRHLLTVVAPPFPDVDHPVVPPCAFRSAVARGRTIVEQGHRLSFLDLPGGNEPVIEVDLPSGDRALPGGIYRIGHDRCWSHLFPTDLDLDATKAAAADGSPSIPVDGPAGSRGTRVGFHHDAATAITLVHTTCDAGDVGAARRQVEVLEAVLARCVTAELLSEVTVHAG